MNYLRKFSRFFILLIVFAIGIVLGAFLISSRQSSNNNVFKIPDGLLNQIVPPSWNQKTNLPGNSFSTATKLQTGLDTQGTLTPGNITDYYTFNLKQAANIIVTVANVPKDFGFILYDSSYTEVAHTLRYGSTAGTTTIKITNAGKYYLKVFGNYTEVVNVPYTIRVSVLPFFE